MINIAHGNISEIDLTNFFFKLRIKYKDIIKLNFYSPTSIYNMLNIYNVKLNKQNKDKVISLHKKGKGKDKNQGEELGLITHYPPANKE